MAQVDPNTSPANDFDKMANLTDVFQSKRLIFRAIQDTDAEKQWFHRHIKSDPILYALGDSGLLRPQTRSSSDVTLESLAKEFLGVVICLKSNLVLGSQTRAESSSSPATMSTSASSSSSSPPSSAVAEPAATSASSDSSDTSSLQRIGILSVSDEASDSYRHHHRLGVLSIRIAEGYRDRGYGGEALSWATNWGFTCAGLHSVSLGCVEYNARATHLYARLGFVLEGRFRKSHFHQRRWWDVLLFSMLEEEWEELQRKKEGVCQEKYLLH